MNYNSSKKNNKFLDAMTNFQTGAAGDEDAWHLSLRCLFPGGRNELDVGGGCAEQRFYGGCGGDRHCQRSAGDFIDGRGCGI